MPGMPRVKNKATKIAWSILGEPLALQQPRKTKEQKQRDKRLTFEETTRVR
jgi:hypothetical protein